MISEKAATIVGTIGTVCFCGQLIPQIYFIYKKKDCTGCPPLFMFLWFICSIPFACYTLISSANLVLEIQPHIFMVFSSICYAQTLYYPPYGNGSYKRIIMHILPIYLLDIACEAGFIPWLRPLYSRGTKWPGLIFGILASILLALGLVPPYLELFKRRGEVVGISFVFLSIDCAGAWLSFISIILGNMDIMGMVLYIIVGAMEFGIFGSHLIWCCRFKWFGNGESTVDDQEKQLEDGKDDNNSDINSCASENENQQIVIEDKSHGSAIEFVSEKKSLEPKVL